MAKVLCVLYDDPVDGYPKEYARDDIPKITKYPDGQTAPTPKAIDFKPGELLGSVSGELGLRKFLESQGHTLVVTSDKDGPNSTFEKELPDAEVVICSAPPVSAMARHATERRAGLPTPVSGHAVPPRRPRRRRRARCGPTSRGRRW